MPGRKNVAFGLAFLGLFMAAGFLLGYLHDLAPDREAWIAQYATGTHFETRMMHAHGSLFALINVAIGLVLIKLPIANAGAISWLALAGLLMPIGILLHALFGIPPLLVLVGGLSMIVATLWTGWVVFRLA